MQGRWFNKERIRSMATAKSANHRLILIVGDLLVILSFVWVGRSSHSLSMTNIAEGLSTALPFIISWFLITPWFGIYRAEVSRDWRKLVPRLLGAWAIAGPVALVLRALFLGRPLPEGIIPTFAVVSLGYIGLVALVWRLGYNGWVNRSLGQGKDATGSKP
jgi:hypothetical protein